MDELRKLVESYVKFESLGTRRVKAKRSSRLLNVVSEFVEFIRGFPNWRFDFMEKVFRFGKKIADECCVDLRDIETLFNELFPKFVQGGLLGCFISGLYHKSMGEGDKLILDLRNYSGSISGLAYKHRRGKLKIVGNRALYLGFGMSGGVVEIEGSVGNYLGKLMSGGEIRVNGNAGDWIGVEMKGGKIVIEGNAGSVIGRKMEGGEIIVKGNAGFWVGDDMKGGIIRIYGNAMSISPYRSGGTVILKDIVVKNF
jgi:formylmethanofuran dehydrogenase subunit C